MLYIFTVNNLPKVKILTAEARSAVNKVLRIRVPTKLRISTLILHEIIIPYLNTIIIVHNITNYLQEENQMVLSR